MLHPSIFNSIIGPVMRGPSSSHTAASVRIGRMARNLLGEEPALATFVFDPNGSLATTYRGQGSAMGLAAGLLGMEITDPRMMEAEQICDKKKIALEFKVEKYGASHPNTYKALIKGVSGKAMDFTALSTGGGAVKLIELNGKKIDDDHEYIKDLMPVKTVRNPDLPFRNIEELTVILKLKRERISDYAYKYETAIGELNTDEIRSLAMSHAAIMRDSIVKGLKGVEFKDRLLHHQSHLISKSSGEGKLIPAGTINNIIASVTAIMETKSAMGVIVAAPTAGSCGVIGGSVLPMADYIGKTENETARAILAAGLFGVFIAQVTGFAAEEGGCQYECGAASGMAAAALVEMVGGDGITALNAGSMALQNTIGMICDPVADRVEVPCLGKNVMAALNAVSSANMALAGYDPVIPAGEVIKAMKEVGCSMDHRYRCTGKGGLSVTDTAKKLQKGLNNE